MKYANDSNWVKVKLGEIVRFKTGKLDSNAAKPDGEYPFFTCPRETFRTSTYSFDTEAVLLAGNNAAGIFPIKYFKGKFDVYQRTYVIRPNNKKQLMTKYLYYGLQPKLELLKSISTGAATKYLTLTLLNGLEIDLPPLETQHQIASILSAHDDLIENNTRRIAILEEMARLIYQEWFVHFRFPGHEKVKMVESELGPIPEGWEVKAFIDIAEFINGYAFKPSDWSSQGIPIIKIKEFKSGITPDTPKYNGPPLKEKFQIRNIDLLFFWSADLEVYFWSQGDGWLNQHLFQVIPIRPWSKPFLFFALRDKMDQFRTRTCGTTMRHIKRAALGEVKTAIPSVQQIEKFDSVIESVIDLILNLKTKNINLRTQRDLLLPKLISGEIDVSELGTAVPQGEAA